MMKRLSKCTICIIKVKFTFTYFARRIQNDERKRKHGIRSIDALQSNISVESDMIVEDIESCL